MKKVREFGKQDGWFEINPESAAKLLATTEKNRPLNELRAVAMSADIKAGRWAENGETIVVCAGRLIDGQHRLRAVVLAGKPIVSAVINLEREKSTVFDTIDTGRVRTGGDRLAIDGVGNFALVSAMIRFVIAQERRVTVNDNDQRRGGKFSLYEIRARYWKSPESFSASASLCRSLHREIGNLLPLSMVGAVHFLGSVRHPDAANRFIRALATGENCKAGDPVLAFRKRVTDFAVSKLKPKRSVLFALLVKAWIAYRDNKTVRRISFDSTREEYPNAIEG